MLNSNLKSYKATSNENRPRIILSPFFPLTVFCETLRSCRPFEPILPLERFQKRQNDKCSKIRAWWRRGLFWGPGGSKKSARTYASYTKHLGSGKELDFGLTRTALKPFFGLRQGAKHCKLQCFHTFRSRKNMSQCCKNGVNIIKH